MMNPVLMFMFFFLALSSVAQEGYELKWKNIETLEFNSQKEAFTKDRIFFYYNLLKRAENEGTHDQASSLSFTTYAKPLDLYDYWENKGDEQYDVLLTKVAYVLDKPIHFFSEDRLANTDYISQTMPEAKINKIDSTYHISVGFGAPEIDYALHFYTPEKFENSYPNLKNYFNKYDGIALSSDLITVQHNYQYGKVMFQKTSKMSISISRYFQLNREQTLVFNYTLNYIHNIPPSFLGGSDFLLDKIKQGIKALVDQTQYICRTTEFTQ